MIDFFEKIAVLKCCVDVFKFYEEYHYWHDTKATTSDMFATKNNV